MVSGLSGLRAELIPLQFLVLFGKGEGACILDGGGVSALR